MATIKEVAEKAGVSPGTVSKVLKGYPSISVATRERVKAVVKELDYVPNAIASALAAKRGQRIGIYTYINDKTQQIDEIDMSYLLGSFVATEEYGYRPVTIFHDTVANMDEEACMAYLNSLSVQALILFGLNKEDKIMHHILYSGRFPIVVVDADIVGDEISCVMIDHCEGQKEVAMKVVKENDRVLYLAGKKNGYVTDMRLSGMEELGRKMNLSIEIRYADFSEEMAYDIVSREVKEYDAIVCASDLMAIGAKRAGKNIPVTGFDGIPLLGYAADDVWTCQQNFKEIGKKAIAEASQLLQGHPGQKVIVPHVVRKITR